MVPHITCNKRDYYKLAGCHLVSAIAAASRVSRGASVVHDTFARSYASYDATDASKNDSSCYARNTFHQCSSSS